MSQPTRSPNPPEIPRVPSPTPRKRKHRPWMPQKKARRRMKEYAGHASQMLQLALTIAAASAGDAGIPGLSSGLQALLELLKKIQAMKTNVEGVETLATRITALKDALEKLLVQHWHLTDDMQERIDALCRLWGRVAEDAQHIKCRGMIRRFFTSNVDAMKLQDLVRQVSQSIGDFLLQSVVNIEANVHSISRDVAAIKTNLEMAFLPVYAKHAQYDSNIVRRGCLEGTREDVLADAYNWIEKSSAEARRTSSAGSAGMVEGPGHFLWINGLAGTGKTTIAFSLAEKCNQDDILGANFFCSRSDAECSDPSNIFITIARQLCQHYAPYKEQVAAALAKTPDIATAGPLRQFQTLILEPLKELKGVFPVCVIIIDALDECRDGGVTSTILGILARHIRELTPFLFVVTSRPEPHITAMFERAHEESLKNSTESLVLHNVQLNSVLDDIRLYLADGFRQIRKAFFIEDEWPSNQDLNKLAELSQGLFIFATTVLRFIHDPDYSDPRAQLQVLLASSVSIMHDLYREVLRLAYNNVDTLHKTNPRLPQVLGAITVAEEPLSAATLGSLLDMEEGDIRNTLSRLRSVLHIPEESSSDAICFIHPTFPEFLLDSSVVKPEAFRIVPTDHHLTIFTRTLVAMDCLKRNIAGVERSAAFVSEMPGLSDTVKECIPAHVAYACRFWSIHFLRCAGDTLEQESCSRLNRFLTRQMLYWLEACSLMRVLDSSLAALHTAEHVCQNVGGSFDSVIPLLADYHRFLWMYYYCIDTAPLQVYHSALTLAPAESLVVKSCTQELDESLIVYSGAPSNWPPRRDAITGHDGKAVYAIAFSPDGDYFVTGGGNHKLEMRKTSTRAFVRSFDGHTADVYCVAFSPDGAHVASGSADQDVCVWQVSSGECIHKLNGHTSGISSVAYRADGRILIAATDEGEVKLWDISDGCCILTLEKTKKWTWQAGLSPDGGIIARGSTEGSLSLYDVSSATDETLDFPDDIKACTFSPDNRYVAARSGRVIRVWQRTDMSLVRSIDMPEWSRCRLAFSRDGTCIGCGSASGNIYLWHVRSGEPPLALRGHPSTILDISVSSDGLQVASACQDGTIRVYDVAQLPVHTEVPTTSEVHSPPSRPPQFVLVRHKSDTVLLHLPSAKVDSTRFTIVVSMPEGAPMLTLFADMVDAWNAALQFNKDSARTARACAWAVITGQQHIDFSDTWDATQPVCISQDGLLLAYRSPTSDYVVDVCNLRTGRVVASLAAHTGHVHSIVFSPDSALIATSSKDDFSVKVWSTTTGDIVHSHEGHTNRVRALAFSSDNRFVASGSDDRSVHVFDATTGHVERVFDNHRDWVVGVLFTAEDKRVLALDDSSRVCIWDRETGTRTYELSVAGDSWTHSLTVSSNSSIPVKVEDLERRPLPICALDNRSWPAYTVSKDGWVYARSPGCTTRLCWLPPEWRNLLSWDGARFCCSDQGRRIAVGFDVSRLPEYVRLWGSGV